MAMRRVLLIFGLLLSLTGRAEAACKLSDAVRRAFVRTHPCPSTQLRTLPGIDRPAITTALTGEP